MMEQYLYFTSSPLPSLDRASFFVLCYRQAWREKYIEAHSDISGDITVLSLVSIPIETVIGKTGKVFLSFFFFFF